MQLDAYIDDIQLSARGSQEWVVEQLALGAGALHERARPPTSIGPNSRSGCGIGLPCSLNSLETRVLMGEHLGMRAVGAESVSRRAMAAGDDGGPSSA